MIEETKYYVDPAGALFGYPKDGSQDAQIPRDQKRLTDEEAKARLSPAVSIVDLAAQVQAKVDAEFTLRVDKLTAKYPDREIESWPVQTAQAQTVVSGSDASTPWLDSCAQTRGMSREELANRILALNSPFQVIHGFLTGNRQWHEEAIGLIVAGAEEDEAQARAELASYDVLQGWARDGVQEPA